MKQVIVPKDTSRAQAFELWMMSPMPMVTLAKTFDVTRLLKVSRRRGMKLNMLLCWCIGKTASTSCVTLPISFQFHHVQMDGGHAARFLEEL
jgi:chloramphenicol O-acetyltransferase